jgi:glycosyltransferase involved in cell wall biosynthesis
VPTGDVRGLSEALQWMLDHPEKRRTMAEEGRALCAERFAASRMIEQLDSLYRWTLDSAANRKSAD